jgi:hypothetical protein
MQTLTVFCCGTAFHREHPKELIAELFRHTGSEKVIFDGVGSGKKLTGKSHPDTHNPGGHNIITGGLFGVGMDENVNAAVKWIIGKYGEFNQQVVVNLVGWSRGGVMCFKVANTLYNKTRFGHIEVRIFAIDPVPGSTGPANKHSWQNLPLTPNVKRCKVIIAQHVGNSKRRLFYPILPDLKQSKKFEWIPIPGDHSSVVIPRPNREHGYELTKELAMSFLARWGTTINNYNRASGGDDRTAWKRKMVEHYSGAYVNYRHYTGGNKKFRVIRTADEKGKTNKKNPMPKGLTDNFFINDHDKKLFKELWPEVFNWVISSGDFPYLQWNKIMGDCMHTGWRVQWLYEKRMNG